MHDLYYIFHENPEVSGKEEKTKKLILSFFDKLENISLILNNSHGLVFSMNSNLSKTFDYGFRSELDAVKEVNNIICHGCGHDAHIVALCTFAAILNKKLTNKNFLFVFQSSEEFGNGGEKLVSDMKNQNIHVNNFINIHNAPDIPVGYIATKEGKILANNLSVELHLSRERNSHFDNRNSLNDFCTVFHDLETLQKIHPIKIKIMNMNTNGNISSEFNTISIALSFRSFELSMIQIQKIFKEFIEKQVKFNCRYKFITIHSQVDNSKELVDRISKIKILKNVTIPENMSSDDFNEYINISNNICYFFVGSFKKSHSNMHECSFEVDERFISNSVYAYLFMLGEESYE